MPGKLEEKFKGRDITLMSIAQYDTSRVVFAGSMDAFSNQLIFRSYTKYFMENAVTNSKDGGTVASQNSTPKLIMHVRKADTIVYNR